MSQIDDIIKSYSSDEWLKIIGDCTSIRQVGKLVGLTSSTQYYRLGAKLKELYPDAFNHFLGKAWNKNNYDMSRFKKGVKFKSDMRFPLIHLRGHICEKCHNTLWFEEEIPLEVHHIDGDEYNNEISNLMLLCPNCHALTENYRGKNSSNRKYVSDEEILKVIKESSNVRQVLLKLNIPASGYSYERVRNLARSIGKYF